MDSIGRSEFGRLLRQLRDAAGLTQEELAASARLSPRSVSDLERGVSRTARPETVRRLAAALALSGPTLGRFRAAAGGQGPLAGECVLPRLIAPGLAAVRALPRDIAGFTGRGAELDRLAGLLADASGPGVVGICAIGGLAGIGKTTLAVHAAHRLASEFPDGQLFVPLHAHTPGRRPVDPADALASLLRVTGYASRLIPADADGRGACWRAHLAGKKVLIVLDDAVGHEQVRPLLPGSGGCLVLVTSRRRLAGLEDASVISLDTMGSADAARLLAVTAGRPGLTADDPEVAEVGRLCGFLPLAIGMLGARLRYHPAWTVTYLTEMLGGARDRLELLSAENVSVAAAFELSYRDLTTAQRRLFRRLGLYPGADIDGYAAAALAGTSLPSATRALAGLYDQHLISEHVPGRYRMHDLIREHARSLAAADDPVAAGDAVTRLLDYYQQAARAAGRHMPPWFAVSHDAIGPVGPPAILPPLSGLEQASAWVADERANLLAAASLAIEAGKPAYAVTIPAAASGFLDAEGNWAQVLVTLCEKVLAGAQDGDDLAILALAHLQLGAALAVSGQYRAVPAAAKKALALYRKLGDRAGQGDVLIGLASLNLYVSDFAAAARYAERAFDAYRAAGHIRAKAEALNQLGIIKFHAGDYAGAASLSRQALASCREIGFRRGEGDALLYLGLALRPSGDYPAASAALLEAQAIYRALGDRYREVFSYSFLASLQRLTGDYPAAAASSESAVRELGDIGDRSGQANAYNELGLVQQLTGDYAAAAASHRAALRQFGDLGDGLGKADALNGLGELSLRTSNGLEAAAYHGEALALARAVGGPFEEARALEGLGRSDLLAGRTHEAAESLRQALSIFERIGAVRAEDVSVTLHSIEASASAERPPVRTRPG